jgi:hypothetical protein
MNDPATGHYLLWLEPGSYTLQATADQDGSMTQAVEITSGQGTTQDFNLVFPDDFSEAVVIDTLPFQGESDITNASVQPGEPSPSCAYWFTISKTTWFAYTPAEDVSLMAHSWGEMNTFWSVYTGDGLENLAEVTCRAWNETGVFQATAGTTYYFQAGSMYNQGGRLSFQLDVTPPPSASFWYTPGDPAAQDTVEFYDNSYDPANAGIASFTWNFGDGVTAEGYYAVHSYAKDGDYTVLHEVTTNDGRTASVSQVVAVKTHDIGIVKFTVPQSAKAGQTRAITVGIKNTRYPERVIVTLYKSTPGGYIYAGSLEKDVPVRSGNRTTDFSLNYTFTNEDERMGKVTFRATAELLGSRDAFPADNEAISLPVKVTGYVPYQTNLVNPSNTNGLLATAGILAASLLLGLTMLFSNPLPRLWGKM